MGDIFGYYFNWGILLQIGCVIHFVRRRPSTYWLWIILMFGPLGSLAYILVEVIPDAGLLRGTFQVFPRRRRIQQLEKIVLDNPSAGNLEELADLYLEDGKPAKARELYDRAITPRTTTIDPYYRRGLAALALNDVEAAAADFSQVVTQDPKYRLPPRRRAPGSRLRAPRTPRPGRGLVQAGHGAVDGVGARRALRRVPPAGAAPGRGAPVGPTRPRQEGDDAGLSRAPRAPLVPPRQGGPQARPRYFGLITAWIAGSWRFSRVTRATPVSTTFGTSCFCRCPTIVFTLR